MKIKMQKSQGTIEYLLSVSLASFVSNRLGGSLEKYVSMKIHIKLEHEVNLTKP